MRYMQLWMRIVGVFYVAQALFNTPPIIRARFARQYPDLEITERSLAAQAIVDVWFMFGLESLVIGSALIYFSRNPERGMALVWTVLGLELVRGIVFDLYLIARGYDVYIYSIWIVVHLLIIANGLIAVRRMKANEGTEAQKEQGLEGV